MNSVYDVIKIENLKVFAHHGMLPEETEKGQNFYINVSLYVKMRTTGLEDDSNQATDYAEVCHFIYNYMREHTFKLIEAAAENLAEEILFHFPQVREIDLEIRKPESPMRLSFESVSVKIRRGWHTAYIAVGSNSGDREQYINNAIAMLKREPKVKVEKVSEIFHTEPYSEGEKKEFLNGAMKLKTLYTPEELLHFLNEIEAANGRERKGHWEDSTLDLDIIFYDNIIMSTDELVIPHPDITNRDFVLVPLTQIDPYAMHPIYHETVRMMLDKFLKTKEKFLI